MARSSGVVMKPRTRSALAPTYAVRTVTVALSSFGYCRTLSERIAWSPAMMITRLTTIARTGRRMKMSVNFTGGLTGSPGGERAEASTLTSLFTMTARSVAQLERARGDDLLPGGDAVERSRRSRRATRRPARTAAARPSRAAAGDRRAAASSFLSSTTNTESPYDACTSAVAGTVTSAPWSRKHHGNVDEHAGPQRLFLVGHRWRGA